MARFGYSALPPEAGSIRLLHLLPATLAAEPLQCYITDHNLKQLNGVVYHALSYVWGDESKTADITLEQQTVSVTTNLDAALRALRRSQDERMLWVDALCINQKDLQEKSAQVRIMWHIYEAAEYVIVWLGAHYMDGEQIMTQFSRREVRDTLLAKQQRVDERRANKQHIEGCSCVSGVEDDQTPRIGMMSIISRDWFTRIWTLQEIAAAKRVEFVCGDVTVDGEVFYEEITAAASQRLSLRKIFRRIRPAVELIGPSETAFRRYKSPLVALIERFRSWNATKPVDKVYALLAFSSDARENPELLPDYDQTPYNLACKIIRHTYPSATIAPHVPGKNSVTFKIDGYVLGKVSSRISSPDRRTWKFAISADASSQGQSSQAVDPAAASIFKDNWMIDILNERKIDCNSTICLLRDAVRPTSLTMNGADLVVGMLATTEPYQNSSTMDGVRCGGRTSWADVLQHFSTRPEGSIKFRLTWDPFRLPLSSEVSRSVLSPNDPQVQWEARTESIKYTGILGNIQTQATKVAAQCLFLANLRWIYWSEAQKLRSGKSKYSINLHHAAVENWVDVVRLLLESNGDPNERSGYGRSALHHASELGHDEMADVLIRYGANVNIGDDNEETPLMLAASNNHLKVAKLLITSVASAEASIHWSRSCLTDPVIRGHVDMVELLLNAGADIQYLHYTKAASETTPLHLAAELGHFEVVRLLLNAGADVNARTSTGTTPLHQASMNGHTKIVQSLILAGANVQAQNSNGTGPDVLALQQGHTETAKII